MRSARMAEGSWLLAIMRSSVFRSRTASPYRYVSPSTPSPPPRNPPRHRPFRLTRRSNGFTDSRYPQYSIFISESNFATDGNWETAELYGSRFLSFYFFLLLPSLSLSSTSAERWHEGNRVQSFGWIPIMRMVKSVSFFFFFFSNFLNLSVSCTHTLIHFEQFRFWEIIRVVYIFFFFLKFSYVSAIWMD